ncbi:hypothetical protein [Actinocatenispora rupis]|uniref:Uncharacterized protein n=1 Tax=Actinocatenispora rupis TaxID=519421 RepID=A0A8J3J8R0_9ACTN|nr:hypothetical protein [Actinocatenispora rupis]GID12222.1 hypothetical protein Aru02nite_31110 [Actinocatenispora rupis]
MTRQAEHGSPGGEPAQSWAGRQITGASQGRTADGVYGVIVSSAVMATSHGASVITVIVTVLVTLVVYWAAERYARLVAERIHTGRRLGWPDIRRELTARWEIVTASAIPLAVLAVLGLLGVYVTVAVLAALGVSTLLLCVAGWEIGRGGRLSRLERLGSAAVTGAFGAAMILLKALLH